MLEEGLKEPKFEEMGEFFKVILWARDENTIDPELYKNNRNPLDKLGLNERQIKAFALMVNENKTFTINNYLNCFEISRVTASKDLNKLESLNLINKVKRADFTYIMLNKIFHKKTLHETKKLYIKLYTLN